jgi:hypothetical protein
MENEGHLLDLPFKGSRDYLHSTDIFPGLTELVRNRFGSQAWVDSLCIRRPFRNSIFASFAESPSATGSFRVRHHSKTVPGWLIPTNRPVTRRVPFDASEVTASAIIGMGSAKILEPVPGFTEFEIFVALMRELARNVDPGQWWFCQLNLSTPLSDRCPMEVRICRTLGGRFLVYELLQANSCVGSARIMLDNIVS